MFFHVNDAREVVFLTTPKICFYPRPGGGSSDSRRMNMRNLAESLTPWASCRPTFSGAPCDSVRWRCRRENNVFKCFSDKDSEQSEHQPISPQKSKIARIGFKKNKTKLNPKTLFFQQTAAHLRQCLRLFVCAATVASLAVRVT